MIKAFDHLHVYCNNVEETAKFFETFLEAKITVRGKMSGNPVIRMDLQGIMIILAPATQTDALTPFVERRGLHHIGIQVHDLKESLEKMKKQGGKISQDYTIIGPPTRPDVVKFAFLEGPDGIHVELIER